MNKLTLNELTKELAISTATAKNWIKLGKINPEFSVDYVKTLKKDIISGKKNYLKSRRNKKYISGNSFYKDYVSKDSKNIQIISNLLSVVNKPDKDEIQFLLAECALQFMNNTLENYLKSDNINTLIEDLISDRKNARAFINKNPELFKTEYVYEENEDILGLLYISLSNMGERKSRGAYYTPTTIVKKLVKNLDIGCKTVFDPCCGTGNFLIQLPKNVDLAQIYGNDIDEISVKITRLNLFLKYRPLKLDILYSNITNNNFLYTAGNSFDYIIGNPPWGYDFTEQDSLRLREMYKSAVGKNIESYDIFIERSLRSLEIGGELAFVLPEAVLNVQTHIPIREIIRTSCELCRLEFLGNAFDGVNCPSVIIQFKVTGKSMSGYGAKIVEKTRSYVIDINREISSEQFNFSCDDEEYLLLKKLYQDKVYLKDNAEFALGIVTGDNRGLISDKKTSGAEVVIKGSDIVKYGLKEGANFIKFTPDKFQQVAPESFYRAKEKLLYRFISNKLIFAYDNEQRLSLNSCNILIPHLEGYDIKYIMAVLNSSVAQFVFAKRFKSIKVLRSHIENIPIPKCSYQAKIVDLAECLVKNPDSKELYNLLDGEIAKLYGLAPAEYKTVLGTTFQMENEKL